MGTGAGEADESGAHDKESNYKVTWRKNFLNALLTKYLNG